MIPETPELKQLAGTGPNADRQESSHPHQIYFYGNELLVPDLGADRTWRFQRGATGEWEVRGSVEYAPGSGPRHVVVQGLNILSANFVAFNLTADPSTL